MDSIIMKEALVAQHQEQLRRRATEAARTTIRDRPSRPRWRAQPFRLAVAVIAMTLLFAWIMTGSVEARPSFNEVYGHTDTCLDMNADPYILDFGFGVFVGCIWDDGYADGTFYDEAAVVTRSWHLPDLAARARDGARATALLWQAGELTP